MSYDITSPSNERIKWLVRLRERRHRDAERVFVVEGERVYERALSAGLMPDSVFVDGSIEIDGATTVAAEVLDKASYRSRSQGVIAVFPQFDTDLEGIGLSEDALILVIEGIEKPGNLGAMLRTAAAAGVDGVVALDDGVDVFNPNVLRSSTGAVFDVPLAAGRWEEVESWLEDHDLTVIATSPEAPTSLWAADLTGPTALLIGAEDMGLSDRAIAAASVAVSIPQHDGTTDSLNASVAAGIVLFEAVRQRAG